MSDQILIVPGINFTANNTEESWSRVRITLVELGCSKTYLWPLTCEFSAFMTLFCEISLKLRDKHVLEFHN